MKKIMLFIIALIPICLLFTVQVSTTFVKSSNYISVDRVVLSKESDTINKTSDEPITYEFSAKVVPISATEQGILYSSSDETVATVDENGLITFLGFGSVVITATSKADKNINATCTFFITDTNPHEIEILNKRDTLNIGESFYLETVIRPEEALDKNVTYSSSNKDVVTVSLDGKVTAVGSGSAKIFAKTVNGKVDQFELDVVVPLTDICIDEESSSTLTGKTTAKFPNIVFEPIDATNKEIIYSSADESVATISQIGDITFKKAGTVLFTATSVDGNHQVKYSVTSTFGYVISADIVSSKDIVTDYVANKELDFRFNIYPSDINMDNVKIASDNDKIVKVVDNKLFVTGGGATTVTLSANNGTMWLESKVNIQVNRKVDRIVASNMEIDKYTAKIDCVVEPMDHTEEISYKTSSNLAKVNDNGYISFTNPGTVTVTISSTSGVTKEIVVVFKPNESDFILKEINSQNEELTLNYLESFVLSYNISVDVESLEITYDENMLTLENKLFRAIKGGSSVVTISDGNTEIKINITTIRKAEDLILYDNDKDVTNKKITTVRSEIKLTTTVLQEDTTNKSVTMTSSDNKVATVNNGVVTFTQPGTVTITAKIDNVTKKVVIQSTLGKAANFDIKVDKMVTENGTNKLTFKDVGLTSKIEITNYNKPSDYVFNISHYTFSSTNNNIVTVDNNGNLKAIGRGNAIISIISGKVSKTINVTVEVLTKSVDVTYTNDYETIVLDHNKIIGNELLLGSKVYPENANNQQVEFLVYPDGNDIAEIVDGKLVFSGYGEVKVRVMTLDSNGKVYKDVYIERIEQIDNLKIFEQSKDVTGKTITKRANDNVNVVLEVVPSISNVLDPENINYNMLTISNNNIVNEQGLTTKITKGEKGVFIVTKTIAAGVNKKLSSKLTFTYGNANSATVTIVYSNLQDLGFYYYELNGAKQELLNSEDNSEKYGLERKRVFGTHSVVNGELSTTWNLRYFRTPANNTDALYWFSSDESFAKVSNGIITIQNPNFDGEKTVEIIISESSNKNDLSCVRTSYIFTFVNAVNVWNNADFCAAMHRYGVVLHTNLGVAGEDDADHTVPFDVLTRNDSCWYPIYGNGRTINFNIMGDSSLYLDRVTNVCIRGANTDTKKNFELSIRFTNENAYARYSIFENMKKTWTNINQSFTFSNCIFRYASQCGVQIGKETTGDIYFINNIFFDVAKAAIDYQNGRLFVKGIFDVYNYREASEIATGVLSIAQYAIKDAFKNNEGYCHVWETGSVIKTKHYAVNIAITCMPSGLNEPVLVDTVYFYSHNDGTKDVYVANEDKTTGLKFSGVSFSVTLGITYNVTLFFPENNQKILYGQTPTKADINKIARKLS